MYAHILLAGVFLWLLPQYFDTQKTPVLSFQSLDSSLALMCTSLKPWFLQLTVLQMFSLFSLLSYSFSLSPSTAYLHLSSHMQPNRELLKSPWSICNQLPFNLHLLQSYCISAPRGNHSCGTPMDPPICFNLFLCPSLRRGDCIVIFLPSFAGRLRMLFQAAAKPI